MCIRDRIATTEATAIIVVIEPVTEMTFFRPDATAFDSDTETS